MIYEAHHFTGKKIVKNDQLKNHFQIFFEFQSQISSTFHFDTLSPYLISYHQ